MLQEGVRLEDGITSPAQAEVESVDERKRQATIKLIIHEGRNRQVRRMCEYVGHPVVSLKRVQLGFLELKELPPGQYRFLVREEVDKLRALFH